jgi:hypothetical protein
LEAGADPKGSGDRDLHSPPRKVNVQGGTHGLEHRWCPRACGSRPPPSSRTGWGTNASSKPKQPCIPVPWRAKHPWGCPGLLNQGQSKDCVDRDHRSPLLVSSASGKLAVCKTATVGPNPTETSTCGCSQVVRHFLAMEDFVGSIPIIHSDRRARYTGPRGAAKRDQTRLVL